MYALSLLVNVRPKIEDRSLIILKESVRRIFGDLGHLALSLVNSSVSSM